MNYYLYKPDDKLLIFLLKHINIMVDSILSDTIRLISVLFYDNLKRNRFLLTTGKIHSKFW